MEPLSALCARYIRYLKEGGTRVTLPPVSVEPAQGKLHPSDILLCDRKACYRVMEETGRLVADRPETDEELLSFQIGYIVQDFVGEALRWADRLVRYEEQVGDDLWQGRYDALISLDGWYGPGFNQPLAILDVKTTYSKRAFDYLPSAHHIAQVEKYLTLSGLSYAQGLLYYVHRVDFTSALVTWEWSGADCIAKLSNGKTTTLAGLGDRIRASEQALEEWLRGGPLPPPVTDDPDNHWLCRKDGRPNCRYGQTCWGELWGNGQK